MDFEEIKNAFSDLDPNNPGTWPIIVQLITGVALTVASIIVGYIFYIEDINISIDRFKNDEGRVIEEYSIKQLQANSLPEYEKQVHEVNRVFEKILKQLPLETQIEALLKDIDYAAIISGVKTKSIKKEEDIEKAYYYVVPISIDAEGGYNDIALFMENLASLPRIVTIHNISIEPIIQNNNFFKSIFEDYCSNLQIQRN